MFRLLWGYWRKIYRLDIYGQELSLKFKKHSKFKTRLGGFITLFVSILTGFWILITIQQVFESKIDTIITSEVPIKDNESQFIELDPSVFGIVHLALIDGNTKEIIDSSSFSTKAFVRTECLKYFRGHKINLINCNDTLENSIENGYQCLDKDYITNKFPVISQTLDCREDLFIIIYKKNNKLNFEQFNS